MRNFFKPLTESTEKLNCRLKKTVIEVNSDKYNSDKNYEKSINQIKENEHISTNGRIGKEHFQYTRTFIAFCHEPKI